MISVILSDVRDFSCNFLYFKIFIYSLKVSELLYFILDNERIFNQLLIN